MKVIDTVLPPAKTELEDWTRWMNRIETELKQMSHYNKRVIKIKQDCWQCGKLTTNHLRECDECDRLHDMYDLGDNR